MKSLLIAAAAVVLLAPTTQAQDGVYFGAGATTIRSTTSPDDPWGGYEPTGRDAGLALTLGYRFPAAGTMAFGIEANLDVTSGKRMTNSCVSTGPAWCDVENILRLRGTMTFDLGEGGQLTTSLGAVRVNGVSEDNPLLFVDTTGRGASFGLGWQPQGGMPLRYDLNIDRITSDDTPNYDRSLDLIGLRVSYMF